MRLFSGIQPTGDLHLGNYLGAIKNWIELQKKYSSLFCIVDYHAITVPQDPKELKKNIRETTAVLIAAGIDPKKSTVFVQSHVSAHTELTWILNCLTPMGWMERMTQFKEKSKKGKQRVGVGLFDYPALMASDILLYNTDVVPVGEDQQQHVELTRDIAERFNSKYGKVFKIPKAIIPKTGARIMSLSDPTKKMSKSEKGARGHAIFLLDSSNEIRSKIIRATTDSLKSVCFDKKRPGIYNLVNIYERFSELKKSDIEARFKGKGYQYFKKDLAQVVIEGLRPLQKRYKKLMADKTYIDSLLKKGASKVRPMAEKNLSIVKNKVGLG